MWSRLLAICCLAAGLAGTAAKAETLSVGVEDLDYLPHYGVKDGNYTGFARAVMDAFAADRGHEVRYRPFPVQRLFKTFLEGEVDFKYPDSPQWKAEDKRGHTVTYSDPVIDYIDGVVVKPENKGLGVDAIKRLGTIRGFTPWIWLDRIAAGTPVLTESTGFEPLLSLTLIGRVDGAYANIAVVRHVMAETLHRPGALVFDPALPHIRDHYYLSSIRRPDVIAEFNAWLAANSALVKGLQRKLGLDDLVVAAR